MMHRKFILFLFLPALLFGQYANNIIIDSGFDGAWNILGSNVSITGGKAVWAASNDGAVYKANPAIVSGKTYKASLTISGYTSGDIGIRHSGPNYKDLNLAAGGNKTYIVQFTTTSTYTNQTLWIRNVPLTASADDYYLWEKIDTLYTDGSQTDNTDNDTTKTLAEAFNTRGTHPGGTFITIPGTYSETITAIDSSFTLWKSSVAGSAVTVDAVDFNSITATLLDVYVTTPTNDSNITYTYTPTTTTRKRNFDGWGKYGGWLK